MPAALAYPLAAVAEIAGCFAIWVWWRLGASALWIVPGIAALVVFGWLLAQVETVAAGRAFAAYGGSISRLRYFGCGWRKDTGRTGGICSEPLSALWGLRLSLPHRAAHEEKA
jgi:hypothetical protein